MYLNFEVIVSYCNSVRCIPSLKPKLPNFKNCTVWTHWKWGVQQHISRCGHPVRIGRKSYRATPANSSGHVCVCVFWQDRTQGYCDRLKHFFFIIFPMPSAVRPAFTSPVSNTPSRARAVRLPRTMVTGRSFSYQFIITIITTWSLPPPPFLLVHHVPPCLTLFVYPARAHAHTKPSSFCAAKTSAFAFKRPFVCGEGIKIIIE